MVIYSQFTPAGMGTWYLPKTLSQAQRQRRLLRQGGGPSVSGCHKAYSTAVGSS